MLPTTDVGTRDQAQGNSYSSQHPQRTITAKQWKIDELGSDVLHWSFGDGVPRLLILSLLAIMDCRLMTTTLPTRETSRTQSTAQCNCTNCTCSAGVAVCALRVVCRLLEGQAACSGEQVTPTSRSEAFQRWPPVVVVAATPVLMSRIHGVDIAFGGTGQRSYSAIAMVRGMRNKL